MFEAIADFLVQGNGVKAIDKFDVFVTCKAIDSQGESDKRVRKVICDYLCRHRHVSCW